MMQAPALLTVHMILHYKSCKNYTVEPLLRPYQFQGCLSVKARKSESVGRIVFVNVVYEYHCKNRKRATAAFSSFSSLV